MDTTARFDPAQDTQKRRDAPMDATGMRRSAPDIPKRRDHDMYTIARSNPAPDIPKRRDKSLPPPIFQDMSMAFADMRVIFGHVAILTIGGDNER